jgi:hypothetical protein
MSRDAFDKLVYAVAPLFKDKFPRRRADIDVKLILAVTLYHLAHNQSYRQLGRTFGISQSYVHEVMRYMLPCICEAINSMPGLELSFSNMTPEDWAKEQRKWTTAGNHGDGRYSAFKGCVGAVDGTLINIQVYEPGYTWEPQPW